MKLTSEQVLDRVTQADRVWVFLDYDGTLADFAPTPAIVTPQPDVIDLIQRLVQLPRMSIAVISGRALPQVQQLIPVPGVLLGGTYGIELKLPSGEIIHRADYGTLRPALEKLKIHWQQLVAGRTGFFVEDKAWAVALHARHAKAVEADRVIEAARILAAKLTPDDVFRQLGGQRFFEVAPRLADKGQTVEYVLEQWASPDALPCYLGDDDKDEEAFAVIKAHGGLALVVADHDRETQADARLASPLEARQWLSQLAERLSMAD
jgi:trehalose-phosphatase